LLADEYSFPCARETEPVMLPFRQVRAHPVLCELFFENRHYIVNYEHYTLSVEIVEFADLYEWWVPCAGRATWSPEDKRTILTLLGDAIRARSPLDELRFPQMADALPSYDGGPLRGYALPDEFIAPRGIAKNRFGLAARDYHRWRWLWRRFEVIVTSEVAREADPRHRIERALDDHR
jgi:hypothetical protein